MLSHYFKCKTPHNKHLFLLLNKPSFNSPVILKRRTTCYFQNTNCVYKTFCCHKKCKQLDISNDKMDTSEGEIQPLYLPLLRKLLINKNSLYFNPNNENKTLYRPIFFSHRSSQLQNVTLFIEVMSLRKVNNQKNEPNCVTLID